MSTFTTPTNEKLSSLNCEADWRPWFNMIQGRASFLEIWDEKSDLTKDGLRAFKEDKEEHQKNVRDSKIQHNLYKEQRQRILQLSTLIQTTVASHLQESSCLAGLTLTDWISNLKSSVGADDDTERERLRTWYRTTLRSFAHRFRLGLQTTVH
ncbi:hypothetical protein E4U32_003983 [Claviceps aff. humidiphila group G2b]|nr:hypothetical protein E4U32_003983 [Claviceps aff. humidiphila group G2b]